MENQNKYQAQEFKKENVSKQISCYICSTPIEVSDSFCPECGIKINQEVTICKICGNYPNGSFCDNCGNNQISNQCKKCSTESLNDFCESCGEPLTELATDFMNNQKIEEVSLTLTSIEAEGILKEMESLLRPDVKRIQEKMRQRIILNREREYFQEREERIKLYQSGNRPKIQVIQAEDMQKIQNQMKNFSGYLERQIQKKEEEDREAIRQKKEENARIAEEKRQKKANRVSGIWVSTSGKSQITLDLRDVQSGLGKAYVNDIMMETIDILNVKWTGSRIEFHTIKTHVKWIIPLWVRVNIKFTGRVNEDGEMMTGFLSSAENWQEVFIKN